MDIKSYSKILFKNLIQNTISNYRYKGRVKNYIRYYSNSGKLLLVPYTKDFGIITRF